MRAWRKEASLRSDWDALKHAPTTFAPSSYSRAFHLLEPIAERIEDVNATKTVEGGVWLDSDASAFAGSKDGVEIFDDECGMGALRGSEIELDAKVKIHGAGHEPEAFALGHLRRLFDLGEAEDTGVEGASAAFAGDGNDDLHVIKADDWHGQ